MATTLDTYILEAEAFFQSVFSAVEGVFGAGNPLTNSLTGLAAKVKADIEAVRLTVDGVEQTLIPTKAVWDQIMAFVGNVKAGVKSGPLAGSWEQEVLNVLQLGVPIALNVLAPGSGPLVTLSLDVAEKLIALL